MRKYMYLATIKRHMSVLGCAIINIYQRSAYILQEDTNE